jgi:putative aminopeptidase FrvX
MNVIITNAPAAIIAQSKTMTAYVAIPFKATHSKVNSTIASILKNGRTYSGLSPNLAGTVWIYSWT